MPRRAPEPVGPTNAETLALKREFELRTIIEFHDRDWQQRTGLVVGASRGGLVVLSPAKVALMPRKTWKPTVWGLVDGVRTRVPNPDKREPTPTRHHVPRARIVRVLRAPRRRPVEEE